MFYTMYLSSVCQRRQWPDPHYEPYTEGRNGGIYCKVRVNNRVYRTDVGYENEALAFEGAALKAYMICRNFSANDGMYPGQRPGSGTVQGLPVAIGTGRTIKRNSDASYDSSTSSADGTSSGGNSPRSTEGGFEQQMRQVTPQVPRPPPRSSHGSQHHHHQHHQRQHQRHKLADEYVCPCQRGTVRQYGRCAWCLQEMGWAR